MMWFKNFRATLAWGVLVMVLSLFPGQYLPGIPDFYNLLKPDKIVHLILFGTMSFLLLQSVLKQYGHAFFRYYGIVIGLVAAIIYGGVTEYLQYITNLNRSGNIYDFIANTLGCILGALLFLKLNSKKSGKENASLKNVNTLAPSKK